MRKSCLLLLLLVALDGWAQKDSVNQLSVGLNMMVHGEACGGGLPRGSNKDADIPEDHSQFLLSRNRLVIDYERKGLQTHAIVQNKYVWGMKGNQSLNLYEGWVKLSAPCGLFAQAGRIALSYDDERIIGTNDFAMASQSHDVARVGYEGHGHKVHAILAYNQNSDEVYSGSYYANGAFEYKSMQTVWYHYDVPRFPLGVSLLFMNIGIQAGVPNKVNDQPRIEYQQMYGGYFLFSPRYLTLEGSYYRQGGTIANWKTNPDTGNKEYNGSMDLDAWMASIKATVSPSDRYGFELGYEYLSGDDYVAVVKPGSLGMVYHKSLKGFTPLYGSRTKFYGMMDYFYESAYINGFTPGLQNAYGGVFGTPVKGLQCKLLYHYLAVSTDLEKLNRTLGHSVEFQASYRFSNDVSLNAGYTQMMGTETMDQLKQGTGNKRARWGWFSLVISPSVFTTKW